MSPFIARLRQAVGHDLLVLPSVAVLPWDEHGRVLLVRQADSGLWATIGGAVEPDESPQQAAVRETAEEASVTVELGRVRAVVGGRDHRVRYPNGDQTSYVSTVFDARVTAGRPGPDGDETLDVAWFAPSDLDGAELADITRAVLRDAGVLPPERLGSAAPVSRDGRGPLLVLVTGLQGSGKSTVADLAADDLGAAVLGWDWVMAALGSLPELRATLEGLDAHDYRRSAWSVVWQLATAELRRGRSVVVDGVARDDEIAHARRLAEDNDTACLVVSTRCDDLTIQRARIEGRRRNIPGWHELDWDHVAQTRRHWRQLNDVDIDLDTTHPPDQTRAELLSALAGTR